MSNSRNVLSLIVIVALTTMATTTPIDAADVTYGKLAPGAISISEVTGVRAEICRDHLFDPSSAKVRLPVGYHFVSADQMAKQDKAVASLLEREPKYKAYVGGSLCFMSVDHFLVDGASAAPRGSIPMAFWWARAEADPGIARDARMQGKTEWLQLASWYSTSADRARTLAGDPMAQFVDLTVSQTGANQWEMKLVLANEVVTAKVNGNGQRMKRKAPQPGFMTVPFTGDSASLFSVYTYFGHHHQPAEGTWHASGSGVFSNALQIPGEAGVFETLFQDGWQARSALYKFAPPETSLQQSQPVR